MASPPGKEVVTSLPAVDAATPSETAAPPGKKMQAEPTPTATVGSSLGNLAPDFTLKTIDGESLALSHLRSNKILLNFWSIYCGAPIVEFPLIREIYDKYGKNSEDVAVITVCLDGRVDCIKSIEDKYSDKYGHFDFSILLDKEHIAEDSYRIRGVPTTVFIDSQGIIKKLKPGHFHSQDEIESIIESL